MSKNAKAYITGICGFAGSWLAAELISRGYTVRGAALPGESDKLLNRIKSQVNIDRFDITDESACRRVFARQKPEYLFHLAAIASVGQSFGIATQTFDINVNGTRNILEAIKGNKGLQRFLCVSSSDIYGRVKPDDLPLKPTQLPNPVSPYAKSKVAAEYLVGLYADQYGIPVSIVRPFNHTGPGQNDNFVIPSFCKKILAAGKPGGKKVMGVGNLDVYRDISDVRDIVRGYRLIAEKGTPGEIYHLCSGKARRIGDILNKLIEFSDIPIRIQKDRKLFRKTDIPVLRGSFHKTRTELGWKPEITIDHTLRDCLTFWRSQ
ncbi:MAG: GDP-mannose 4,6-dehydratase [Candidatus Zixiibacteriota bacterium]